MHSRMVHLLRPPPSVGEGEKRGLLVLSFFARLLDDVAPPAAQAGEPAARRLAVAVARRGGRRLALGLVLRLLALALLPPLRPRAGRRHLVRGGRRRRPL